MLVISRRLALSFVRPRERQAYSENASDSAHVGHVQVSRIKRELERVESERSRSQEDARRCAFAEASPSLS